MGRWWVLKDRLRHGPFSEGEIFEFLKQGKFLSSDFVSREESQSVAELSYKTISEILKDQPYFVSWNHLNTSNQETRESLNESKENDVSVSSSLNRDESALPKIKELLSKIEAIELVDVREPGQVESTEYKPVEHSSGASDFVSNFINKFQTSRPMIMTLAALGFGFWFYQSQDFTQSHLPGSGMVSEPGSNNSQKRPSMITPIQSSRAPASAPSVSLPQSAIRRETNSGDNGPSEISSGTDVGMDAEESAAISSEGVQSRRERLRKLRSKLSPENADGVSSEPVAGVVSDDQQSQQEYDDMRSLASEEDIGEPPYVDESEEGEVMTDEVQDNSEVLEYQE